MQRRQLHVALSRSLISTSGCSVLLCTAEVQPDHNLRADGVHDHHLPGKPGLHRTGLGQVRLGIPAECSSDGKPKWSAINPSIYSFCFTRKAAISTRCDLCLSTGHVTTNCPLQEDADPDLPIHLKAVETAVLSLAGQSKGSNVGTRIKSGQVCRLFNNDACRYKNCKHLHQCSNFGEQHKAIACPKGPAPTSQAVANRQGRREGTRTY